MGLCPKPRSLSLPTVTAIGGGCRFLHNMGLQYLDWTDGTGVATSAVFNIPVDPALNGALFYVQWMLVNLVSSERETTAGLVNTLYPNLQRASE